LYGVLEEEESCFSAQARGRHLVGHQKLRNRREYHSELRLKKKRDTDKKNVVKFVEQQPNHKPTTTK
jgi:hypothetical protein